MDYFNTFKQMLSLRGLTEHTMISYSTYISSYLSYVSDILGKSPEDVSWQEIRDFLSYIQKQRSLSDRTMNALISQIRFFHIYVLHKSWDPFQIPFRKFNSYLPFVPSREEMAAFLSSISDLKFKAIIVIMYSAGLRIGEVRHLKCSDIEHSRRRIQVRDSKNRSDRYAILSEHTWQIILEYWYSLPKEERPLAHDWLFPQKHDSKKPIDHSQVPAFILQQERFLGWEHRFSCHTFRHAFATYLYEDGTDLLTLQKLMGHKSIASTLIYVHLASCPASTTISPFDSIGGLLHD